MGTVWEQNEPESLRPTVPSFIVIVPTHQEVKIDRYKDKG